MSDKKTLTQVAILLKIDRKTLRSRMEKQGIEPFADKTDARCLFLHEADIQKLDIKGILNHSVSEPASAENNAPATHPGNTTEPSYPKTRGLHSQLAQLSRDIHTFRNELRDQIHRFREELIDEINKLSNNQKHALYPLQQRLSAIEKYLKEQPQD